MPVDYRELTLRSIALYLEICSWCAGEKFEIKGVDNTYISRNISPKNHADHDTQEGRDHERIDQTKPMDAWIENVQIVVPSRSLKSRYKHQCIRVIYIERTHGVSDS